MKSIIKGFYICALVILLLSIIYPYKKDELNKRAFDNSKIVLSDFNHRQEVYIKRNFWNNESVTDISSKINRYLNSSLSGKAEYIVRKSIELNVDPYLTSSVILLETGCQWTCSYLARVCNNFGGNKGSPGCNGGSYRRFGSMEEGLNFAINKLSNYYNSGLTTPEQINPKYATSKEWASKVNKYMNKLKS